MFLSRRCRRLTLGVKKMTYKHPLFKEVNYGDLCFCMYCRRFVLTEQAIACGWTCPECGPELTSPWDIRPYWVGVLCLLGVN